MSQQTATLPAEPLSRILDGLRDVRAGLAIGLAVLGLLFHTEVETAVRTWYTSTAYNHCFLVIPIAAYLLWDRRPVLRGLTAAPIPLLALLIPPLAAVWLVAERLGIMEGRQLVFVTMVEVLFLALLGWRLWWAMLGPLLYLYFLVPFGEFLTPKLQDITAVFVRHGVQILNIPAYVDGYIIEIPEGVFFIAEACAGLRFLIASIAFGALYALMMYRSPVRRTAFILASIVVPVIANGFRALGIVWLGHALGSAEAAAADHVLYGWIFFSIVILLLILIGLPFREDETPDVSTTTPMTPGPEAARRGLFAGIAVAAAASIGPLAVLGLNRAAATPMVPPVPLALSGLACQPVSLPAAPPAAAGATGTVVRQRVECGIDTLDIRVVVFSPYSTAAPVNAERLRLTRDPAADDTTETPVDDDPARVWRIARSNEPSFLTASGLWIAGEPTAPGMGMRMKMARASLSGGGPAPVLVVVTPVVDWHRVRPAEKREIEYRLSAFLRTHSEIDEQVRAIARSGR